METMLEFYLCHTCIRKYFNFLYFFAQGYMLSKTLLLDLTEI